MPISGEGEGYFNLHRYEEAVEDFTAILHGTVVSFTPRNHARVHYMKGMSHYYLGENKEAEEELLVVVEELGEFLNEEELSESRRTLERIP